MARAETSNQPQIVVAERYRLLNRVGVDAATETWEAFDARLERPVVVRLLASDAREDRAAQAQLHQAARAPRLGDHPDAPPVLDGGQDLTYGPFVVAQLNRSQEATQPVRVVDPAAARVSPPPPPPRPRRLVQPDPPRSGSGVLALVSLAVVVLAAAVFLVRVVLPSAPSTSTPAAAATPEQPRRPFTGAPAGQPAPKPTVAHPTVQPTAAQPPVQPTPQPTAQRTAEPTLQPTRPPTGQPASSPTGQPASPPTGQPTSPPTGQPTSPPIGRPASPPIAEPMAPAQAAAGGSPVDAVRQHYGLITAKRYADGYALMDSHLQSLNSPADYAGWFANKVSVEPISVELVSQSDGQAVVRSTVNSTDRVNGQDVTTQVAEQFVLRNEAGAWRIDQVSRL